MNVYSCLSFKAQNLDLCPLHSILKCLWSPLVSCLQVHAYIISYLKKEMPSLFGREKKKDELIQRLPEIYTVLQREHHISPGDFPNVTKMQVRKSKHSSQQFP